MERTEKKNEFVLRPMTLINRRCFDGKDEQERYLLEFLIPFTPEDIKKGCLGHAIKSAYVPREQWLMFDESCINKVIDFSYGANEYGTPVINGWTCIDYLQRKE